MTNAVLTAGSYRLGTLLRGDPQSLRGWIEHWDNRRVAVCLVAVFVGGGLYGAAMGYWRSPVQAAYVAVKFPLIILLTTSGNALLNALLAPLLGLNIGFRQSFLAVLTSFTIASAILGSFSPLIAFMIWNVPPLSADVHISNEAYAVIQLTHVLVIAFAGTAANVRLVQLLRELSGSTTIARRVLFAWLVGNLFLGSQLTWILRPFIGSPGLRVEFLRASAFQGNFYETVFNSFLKLLNVD